MQNEYYISLNTVFTIILFLDTEFSLHLPCKGTEFHLVWGKFKDIYIIIFKLSLLCPYVCLYV